MILTLASKEEIAAHVAKDPLRKRAIEHGDLLVVKAKRGINSKRENIGCCCPDCFAGKPSWWNQQTHDVSCDMPDLVK